MSNRLFDGEIVGKLAQKVLLYPNGTGVYLNTGETGIVVESNLRTPHKPVVRICYAPTGSGMTGLRKSTWIKIRIITLSGSVSFNNLKPSSEGFFIYPIFIFIDELLIKCRILRENQ